MASEYEAHIPELARLVEILRLEPTKLFKCAHPICPYYAVCVFYVPRGCVALPGLEVQPLCPQHIETDGSFEGMYPYIDLTLNAQLSLERGYNPEYCIVKESVDQEPRLIYFSNLVKS